MRKYASRKQLINEKIAYLKTSIEQKYGWELNLDYENKYIKLWSLSWYNINKAKGVSMQVLLQSLQWVISWSKSATTVYYRLNPDQVVPPIL